MKRVKTKQILFYDCSEKVERVRDQEGRKTEHIFFVLFQCRYVRISVKLTRWSSVLFLNPTPSPGQVRTYLIKFDSTCGEKCNCPLNTKFCYRNAVLCLLTKSLRNFSLYPYTDIPKFNKVFLSANLDVNRMLRLSKCDTILSVYTLCTCVCV